MDFIRITSAQNDSIKHVIKLRDRRPREKEQLTVLEGYRELTRAREYGMELVECFFSPEHFLGSNEYPLLETLASEGHSHHLSNLICYLSFFHSFVHVFVILPE